MSVFRNRITMKSRCPRFSDSHLLQGIADVTGLPLGEVVLYNIFYEIFTVIYISSLFYEDK